MHRVTVWYVIELGLEEKVKVKLTLEHGIRILKKKKIQRRRIRMIVVFELLIIIALLVRSKDSGSWLIIVLWSDYRKGKYWGEYSFTRK